MPQEEVKPNVSEAPTQDAQLAAENIASGEEKAPTVDFEGDYKAAQQFSVSDIDRTGEGAKAAEAATAPEQNISKPEETKVEAKPTGNPSDFADMAKDVGGYGNEAVGNVTDDLVEKALENNPKN